MKILILILSLSLSHITLASIITIKNTYTGDEISYEDFISELPLSGHIVMGEFHNDVLIQKAQAKIIQDKATTEQLSNQTALHWEFLNYTDQMDVSKFYAQFFTDKITAEEFITNTAGANNMSYAPVFDALKSVKGKIIAINLPRAIKQQVIKGGINSVDPKYIPDHHYDGDATYKERFVTAMGGHVPSAKVDAYFTAQCLTDSVMADQISKNSHNQLNFVIAGSFHTDFFNGTVIRLEKLINSDIKTLKIVNKNTIDESKLEKFLHGHSKYGQYADYIVVVE